MKNSKAQLFRANRRNLEVTGKIEVAYICADNAGASLKSFLECDFYTLPKIVIQNECKSSLLNTWLN